MKNDLEGDPTISTLGFGVSGSDFGIYRSSDESVSICAESIEVARFETKAIVLLNGAGGERVRIEDNAFYVDGQKVNSDPNGLYQAMCDFFRVQAVTDTIR